MLGRGAADRLGTKARAGAVADRQIKGDAGDGDIHPRQILGVFPAQKAQRAGIARLDGRAVQARPGKGRVLQRLANILAHENPVYKT